MGTRIVITGASGNVGNSLERALTHDPRVVDIVGIARRAPNETLAKTRWVEADVAHDDLARHFVGADAVVHLAWQFHPARRPNETWAANAVGSARVLKALVEAEVPAFVYVSSVGAYSPAPGRRVDESWPTHSLSNVAYGREKAYVERLLDAFEAKHRDCRVVRMRPTLLFQRRAASEQRRIFAGPFLPSFVARPGLLPVLPWPRSLQFQALHSDDAAAALQLACFADARGAFNLAAEPVITGEIAADVLRSRFVPVPDALACRTLELLWGLHLAPAPPPMLDLILQLPLLDTTRARTELDWTPQRTSVDAFREMLLGVEEGAGGATPPLVPDSAAERLQEIATGVGER